MKKLFGILVSLMLIGSMAFAAQMSGGTTAASLSGDFLKLDCSNDPLTGNLDLGANNLNTTGTIEVGPDDSANWPRAKLISVAGGLSGGSNGSHIGVMGQASAENTVAHGVGFWSEAMSDGNKTGYGLYAKATALATGDTGNNIAVNANATSTHAGGDNVAFKAEVSGGANNYSLLTTGGIIQSAGTIEPGTDDTHDLGTSALEWKDGYFANQVNASYLSLDDDYGYWILGTSNPSRMRVNSGQCGGKPGFFIHTTGKGYYIADYANRNSNHDWTANETNPTVRIYSALDPNTNNTRWGSLTHTGTAGAVGSFEVSTGSGTIFLNAEGGAQSVVASSTIESTSGGFKFPDGTIQVTAGSGIYGEMNIIGNGTAETINTQNTWEVVVFFQAGLNSNVTYTSNSLEVVTTDTYIVEWDLASSAAAANKDYEFALSVDDVIQEKTRRKRRYSSTDTGVSSGSGLLSLTAGEILKLEVRNLTDANNITILDATVRMEVI